MSFVNADTSDKRKEDNIRLNDVITNDQEQRGRVYTHIEDVLKLFDSIIMPILLYSSDFGDA